MLSANHWRLAVSALAATVLSSAAASAQPLAMNDPGFFPFPGSVFQQVMREPAPQAMPEESVTEQPAGVVDERFRRQVVAYNTSEAPGTDHHRYAQHLSLLRARRRPRDPLRHRRRPRGLHLGRHADRRPQAGMAGLASAAGDDRAPALSAALHGRRPGQSARRARHVSRQHRVSHPRHQRAGHHRQARVVGLHPPHQRGRRATCSIACRSAPRSSCCR